MIFHAFLIKYAEIAIKGKNRYMFEDALVKQMNIALSKVEGEFEVKKEQGRIYVFCPEQYDYDETVEALQHVFGIVGICPVVICEDQGFEQMAKDVVSYMKNCHPNYDGSFKVYTRRAKKSYPITSMEVSAELGGRILDEFPDASVDVHEPDLTLSVEIRDKIYVYSQTIKGAGGMPIGTNGKAMLLLSGGIDSPVAGYMIAKRGVKIDAVYFHAPPYTSERAKQKVVDLAKQVAKYSGPIRLHVVNFTDIQLYIYDQCPHDELTIIMRRYMMRIAEHFAKESRCLGLITGESIGQVASQTLQSLAATNEVCTLPVYRPVIGFDKQEIVERSWEIGTYETSIQPFEDCCTIFVAKHPVTKPNLNVIHRSETKLEEKIVLSESSYIYDGTEKTPEVSIEGLGKGRDYEVSYADNINAGKAKVSVTGKGNYASTAEKEFTIEAAGIEAYEDKANLSETSYEYDGTEKTPEVTVEGLTEGQDYEVSYEANINAGKAKVIISGKGNYTGSFEKVFEIIPSSIKKLEEKIVLSENSYIYDGKAKTPKVSIEGLTEGTDYEVSYEDNINVGTAKVIFKGKGNYTDAVEKTFTIGHTGIEEAAIKAVEAVDKCVGDAVEAIKEVNGQMFICADHGNADHALNEDGTPNTAHSLNPVPFVYVTENKDAKVENGVLADVAPSILHILGMAQPSEMTGRDLIK